MSNTNTTVEDFDGDGTTGEQDSAVIRALRDEVKALKSEVKTAKQQAEEAAAAARAQIQRELSASQVVSDLGFPKLAPLVVAQIEGDITEESVKSFLDGLGLLAQSEGSPGESGGAASTASAVEGVARLGQAVADAARGSAVKGVIDRLNAAKTPAEIAEIAREAGFAQD